MIRVMVELIPFGIEEEAKVIGSMLIANDGTGTQHHGNYVAVFKSGLTDIQEVTVFNHPRARGVWDLVAQTVNSIEDISKDRESLKDYLRRLLKMLKL